MIKSNKYSTQVEISKRVFDEVNEHRQQSRKSAFDISDEKNRRTKVRLLRRPEVEARTGLSRSTLYEWMKRGEFPQPVKLGARLVAWRERDINEWLENRQTRAA